MHVCKERKTLALVSLYFHAHMDLWTESSEALWVVKHGGDNMLAVIDVKDIQAHIAPPFYSNPHGTAPVPEDARLHYVGEHLGFEIAELDALDAFDDHDAVDNENDVAND